MKPVRSDQPEVSPLGHALATAFVLTLIASMALSVALSDHVLRVPAAVGFSLLIGVPFGAAVALRARERRHAGSGTQQPRGRDGRARA